MTPDFFQSAPVLGNPYLEDDSLRSFLKWRMPPDALAEIEPHLVHVGQRACSDLLQMSLEAEAQPPALVSYDPWGRRVDEIRMSLAWRGLERAAAEEGIVATAYERRYGACSRLYQAALLHLYHASSAYVSCPLAMTDGAARLFEIYGKGELKDQVIGHLTSRDPASFWTSGQWMTERTGGSDVSGTQTIARRTGDGVFRLYGTKWFSSATTSQMAMALARVEGDPPGNRGLSLFFIKLRRADGSLDNIVIHRLKDKLGTRALPTAELTLEGTEAVLIGEQGKGVRSIASLFNVTRLYNAVCAVSSMRRGYALARDYAERRYAFGKKLIDHPLHARTLDEIEWEVWGHLFLTFHVMGLQGKDELGEASQDEKLLLRILTPIAKLYTGKRSVVLVSEALECFGGAGYIEDAGIAKLLRDTQVLSIWEGTTNILSLDVLRAMQREGAGAPLEADIRRRLALITHPKLAPARERLARTYRESSEVLTKALQTSDEEVERSGRRIAFGLARTYIGTLMLEYCQVQPSGKAESVASFWIS